MKVIITTVFLLGLSGLAAVMALEPQMLTKEPLPSIAPMVVTDPVPVPETMVATILAGVGFFMLFRRRRYD